jgi:hypothetical protein
MAGSSRQSCARICYANYHFSVSDMPRATCSGTQSGLSLHLSIRNEVEMPTEDEKQILELLKDYTRLMLRDAFDQFSIGEKGMILGQVNGETRHSEKDGAA